VKGESKRFNYLCTKLIDNALMRRKYSSDSEFEGTVILDFSYFHGYLSEEDLEEKDYL
jgi:hypothetical protein